jgi:hypothetical protein
MFPDSNVIKIENIEETLKQQTISQISNSLICGFAPPEGIHASL